MNIQHSTIRATYVALIFIFFSISFVNAQWKWHGHPQIGFIYDFEIDQDTIYLLRAQHEGNDTFTESLIKMDLEGSVILNDSLILQMGHPSVRSSLTIMNKEIVINNYDLTEPKGDQNAIKYFFDKYSFSLKSKIDVGKDNGGSFVDFASLSENQLDKETSFSAHVRYDDVNADDGELLFQVWSRTRGMEHEYRHQITDKYGRTLPNVLDLISTDFGFLGAVSYMSKSLFFIRPGTNDTVFAKRSHLYCYDHEGVLFDIKEIGQELYQERPQSYFEVKQILSAPNGYYVVGALEKASTFVYMKLDLNLNVDWVHDMLSQDTTEFAFINPFQTKSILSQDGHIYTAGWEDISGVPGGDPRGSQAYKYLIKFDPIERQIVWVSKLDEHYGMLWDLEESAEGRMFVSGAWDRDGDFIPPLFGFDFDSWFIAEVDSLGRIEPIVSIGEEVNNEPWIVFPNPVNQILHVQANIQNRQTQWSAYDLQGRLFWQAKGIVNTVDMSMWPEGVYVIRRQQGEDVSIKRVIKM